MIWSKTLLIDFVHTPRPTEKEPAASATLSLDRGGAVDRGERQRRVRAGAEPLLCSRRGVFGERRRAEGTIVSGSVSDHGHSFITRQGPSWATGHTQAFDCSSTRRALALNKDQRPSKNRFKCPPESFKCKESFEVEVSERIGPRS